MKLLRPIALVLSLGLAACSDHHGHDHPHGEDHDHSHEKGEDHVHVAPHGGHLVILAEEGAHLELVHDAEAGTLTGYVLGAHAEKPVRVEQETLEITLSDSNGPKTVTLAAVANELTGETVGDTSEFHLQSDELKGLAPVLFEVGTLKALGQTFEDASLDLEEQEKQD